MEKYFVTILFLFFSAVLYSGEPVNENSVEQTILEINDSKVKDVIPMNIDTDPGYQTAVNKEAIPPDMVKGKKIMPADSLKKLLFQKKFKNKEHADILRYRIDPDVDADMPRMALDPNIDAKIIKIYPHVGMGLLGLKKCPHRYPHKYYFKK